METLQHLITPLTTAWYQVDSNELVSFGIFFAAMWLIAVVLEAAVKKVTNED
ncbi:hypothetical protein [Rheinheimera baltica]|uniref:Uncharacterized protein n=1 Tax=Rheinheimera baltica TaxID=67576 RepID=A0ABT9I2H1_9GAMM|nr:hypothetical protein [Rheinheimera baltica]MDP5137591.1 hypothetical protein [Rheinheimera baltica]MDP5150953.1 hypothetical protein [Rheinheimera baltica]MDP5190956.1 hypothetical protein [Rheinheimera baltica]